MWKGPLVDFNNTPMVGFGLDRMITDITVQPSFGPLYGQELTVGFDASATTTIADPNVPAFEAYKSASTPIAGFIYPSIKGEFKAYDDVMAAFMSVKSI